MTRQKALNDVVAMMRRHDLQLTDVAEALHQLPDAILDRGNPVLSRLFSYLGGIFIFAGLGIFISMQWAAMSRLEHVLITFGCGFCLFVVGLACDTDQRLQKAATPILLMAALLQTLGLVVLMEEFYPSIDQLHGFLMIHLVMAVQQSCTFLKRRRSVLALTTIYFVTGFFAIALDLLGVSGHAIGTVIGTSLLCVGWATDRSAHRTITPLVYFCGGVLLLITAYDWLDNTPYQILFLGLAAGVIFLSLMAKSRILLFLGTISLLYYLGDFIYENFRDMLLGPIGLMLTGVFLIGIGMLAVRLNNKYIAQTPPTQG